MRWMLVLLLSLVCCAMYSQENEVPYWVMAGILKQETRSTYEDNGLTINYVDRRRGADGERGPFQMTYIAWKQIRQPGERFADLSTDMMYAEQCAMRYLLWLYNGPARKSWAHAIQGYNAGPGKLNFKYYANVVAKARRLGFDIVQEN